MEKIHFFQCPRCTFFDQKLTVIVSHLGVVHSGEHNFLVTCAVDSCGKSYRHVESYRKHLYRKHKDAISPPEPPQLESPMECESAQDDPVLPDESAQDDPVLPDESAQDDPVLPGGSRDNPPTTSTTKPQTFDEFLSTMTKTVCMCFFKLTEEHKVPHSAADLVFADMRFMLQVVLEQFAGQVKQALPFSYDALPRELATLLHCTFVEQIFSCVRSKHAREQFARNMFPFVSPDEVKVGDEGDTSQYVSIGKVLTNILQLKAAPELLIDEHVPTLTDDGYKTYKDFRDGSAYERLRDVVTDASVMTLFVLLYMDEVEIANPLGAKRGVHKLTTVYFTLLNIHPRYRSRLRSVYLVILAKFKDVEKHGLCAILKPLLDDLKELSSTGLTAAINGVPQNVKVIVMAVCGDNLSQHKLGGFSACFSQGRVCRYCMVRSRDLRTVTSEEHCQIRTRDSHNSHLAAVKINPQVNCKLYGVVGPSPISQLTYFDVTMQMAPDVMHDLFEGALAFIIKHVTKGLMDEGTLSLEDLKRVETFPYGFNDRKNRPEPLTAAFIQGGASLKGTASQKRCLFRLYPLIFGTSIPEGNRHWNVLLQLHGIVDLVLSEEILEDWLAYLEVLVEDFIQAFTEMYPEARILPKIHYIVHYARMTAALGPLRQYWCLHFEAKHQYFKATASKQNQVQECCVQERSTEIICQLLLKA
ncbi:uncharacterized protein LOC120850082 [Ixodes scapularis]|uniref:uncharacterized protein LOC120850082 n=1 Tax=Ixodes scapularis TaxID=6945 RepID=UPI001C3849A3|nr:uncharacterized protein LOC120850082 [Ixodes scapularis]